MTARELNNVRELNKKIRNLERHLEALRMSAENIVPILDGLPHPTEPKSRVEKIALKIVENERELADCRNQLADSINAVLELLLAEVPDIQMRTVLLLRYVVCLNFRDIAFQLGKSEARIFQIHHDALEKFFG